MTEPIDADKNASSVRLEVRVSDVAVGNLESISSRGKRREHLFGYEPAISERLAVSLNMPIRARPYSYEGIHPIFDMNMPEGHLRMALMNMFRKAVAGFDALLDDVRRTAMGQTGYVPARIIAHQYFGLHTPPPPICPKTIWL